MNLVEWKYKLQERKVAEKRDWGKDASHYRLAVSNTIIHQSQNVLCALCAMPCVLCG